MWTWIIGIITTILVIWLIISYNRFIKDKNEVDNAWAQIDVQLKKRADLIPNLIETVKGYAKHERETLESVTNARASLMNSQTPKESAKADNMLEGTLKSLFAVSEAYPDLKADQNFRQLQEELSGAESKIAYARQYYNDRVMEFNTRVSSFPSNITASLFGFNDQELYEAPEEDREKPEVSF